MAKKQMTVDDFVHEQTAVSRSFSRNANMKVVFRGNSTYTTPDEIVYPSLPREKVLSDDELRVARGRADHETSHRRHTDFNVIKAVDAECKAKGETLLPKLMRAVEDVRTDALAKQELAGVGDNIAATADAVNKAFLAMDEAKDLAQDLTKIAPLAVTWLGRKRAGFDVPSTDECLKMMDPKHVGLINKWLDMADTCKSTADVAALSRGLMAAVIEEQEKEGGDEGENEGDGGDETCTHEGEKGKGRKGSCGAAEARADMGAALDWMFSGEKPEKDDSGSGYRPLSTEWDQVHFRGGKTKCSKSIEVHGTSGRAANIISKLSAHVGTMSRKLERAILAMRNRGWDCGRESGRLDAKRLVAAKAGRTAVFKDRIEAPELDTAVAMLVDMSGSMGGQKIMLAQSVAMALAMCLDRIDVPFEVLGFTNTWTGREDRRDPETGEDMFRKREREARASGFRPSRTDPMDFYIFKDFKAPFRKAKMDIASMASCDMGNNADSEAVLWAWNRLSGAPEKKKVLLVLSDGYPAVHTHRDDRHLYNHLRNVVNGVTLAGGQCVGIGIMSDEVKQFYPRHVVINNLDELPHAAFDQLSRLLISERFRVDNADLLTPDEKLRLKRA